MNTKRTLSGEMAGCESPNWKPLQELAKQLLADFMWMGWLELEDGRRVEAYKHYYTRRYVHIDTEGNGFLYDRWGRYRPVLALSLLGAALAPDGEQGIEDPITGPWLECYDEHRAERAEPPTTGSALTGDG
jgi:hypothetical protein